jgi:nephrocystin-4
VTFELSRSQGLSRAAYARLYTAGFPPVLDRNSEPPEVIDPNVPVLIDLVKEEQDSLQCNENLETERNVLLTNFDPMTITKYM